MQELEGQAEKGSWNREKPSDDQERSLGWGEETTEKDCKESPWTLFLDFSFFSIFRSS